MPSATAPRTYAWTLVLASSVGCLLAPLCASHASAQTSPGERLPVSELRLGNGMRFLLLPREGAPTISFVVQFGVGGVHERLGTTGTAHLLEHMLFKGTASIGTTDVEAERPLFAAMDSLHDSVLLARSTTDSAAVDSLRARLDQLEDSARTFVVANELDRILTRAGGQGLNATTTSESTIYYVELPSNRAELWFALEADRMGDPVFREFYAERDVVMEERRLRVETSPAGLLYELHLATAYTVHPYGVPVVGYMSDLQSLSRRDVASYYDRYYGPGNAVVAIVGDMEPERMEEWARRYFGWLPSGREPPPVLAEEPPQRGERRVELEWDAEPLLRIGWHVPPSLDDDAPALTVLSSLLTGSRTARLHQRLVIEDRLATSVFSSMGPGQRYPQLFQLDVTPRAPATTAEVEAAIYEELAHLAAEGPAEDELERVRNQVRAGAVRRLQSNLGLAFQLASSESLTGDWRETFRSTGRLQEVDAEDVRRVLGVYFTERNRTVATLVRRVDG